MTRQYQCVTEGHSAIGSGRRESDDLAAVYSLGGGGPSEEDSHSRWDFTLALRSAPLAPHNLLSSCLPISEPARLRWSPIVTR